MFAKLTALSAIGIVFLSGTVLAQNPPPAAPPTTSSSTTPTGSGATSAPPAQPGVPTGQTGAQTGVPATASQQQPSTQGQGTVIVPTTHTAAQDQAAAMGKLLTNDQIAALIRRSGLSLSQLHAKLKAAGLDTTTVDPFFANNASMTGAVPLTGGNSTDFAKALATLGLLPSPPGSDSAALAAAAAAAAGVPSLVFGKDIFNRAATSFDPVIAGPIDPAYTLGVGDEIQIIVTGQVELAYQLQLRRDGSIVIPQVGQIVLAGLTLEAAHALLKARMEVSYSGLATGLARLDVAIGQIRSNAVFVIGEVENPGAMQVNALATVFHAIAKAGGPTDRGSFRDIQVRRDNKVIEHLDLYDYLLRGDAAGDIRLEQGDVVFVPLNHRTVTVVGAVRRPRVFELRESEGFEDLLKFAGGLLPTGSVDRVQIDRILPPEKRTPGVDRVKIDVSLREGADSLARVKLLDGDVVGVFEVGDARRNIVTIAGRVFVPGDYELRKSGTLGDLLTAAQGVMPAAEPDRIKVVRLIPSTGQTELFSVDATTPAGKAFPLKEFDQVEVLDNHALYPAGQIIVDGAVASPETRPYVQGESLRDAIERSGGLLEYAQSIQVARHRRGATFSDTTSIKYTFPITPTFSRDTTVGSFILERDDRVMVLSSPGFRPQQFIHVSGQFKYQGTFAITENHDKIRDVVRLAGDTLPGAYPASFRLYRDGKQVSVAFSSAMAGDAEQNLLVYGGDSLYIGRDPGTVQVLGAVNRPSLIRFQPGLSVRDYIELAGGPTDTGEEQKAIVDYPSGFSKRIRRVALLFHTSPSVISGAVITVPEAPPNAPGATEFWARTLAATTAIASLILAFAAITK